uniref:Uncharacterized protein n=1 Tax=Brassica oleracea var. oleracea TaxID=109376 RepID=A0A0D3ANC2_BRAOL
MEILGFRSFVWTAVSSSKTGFSYHHQLLSLSILFPSSHGALNHYTESSQIVYQPENVGSAMADVFIDAMIAEALRAEKASLSDLQSVSGCAVTVGGICGSLLGGYALNNLKMETICLLFTISADVRNCISLVGLEFIRL